MLSCVDSVLVPVGYNELPHLGQGEAESLSWLVFHVY